MSEEEMGMLELLSECIMSKIDFNNKKEIELFCNELKFALLDLHDPDFIYSSSESESSDDDVEPETIKVTTDKDGFMEIVV
jgi:hypothetical protein